MELGNCTFHSPFMSLSTGEGLNYKTNIRHGSKKALVRVEVVFRPNCVIEQVNILNIIFVCVFVKKCLYVFFFTRTLVQNCVIEKKPRIYILIYICILNFEV